MPRRRLVPALFLALLAAAATAAIAESPFDGHWEGAIEVPGQPLDVPPRGIRCIMGGGQVAAGR